ncbi:C cytochrome precursor [Myxococcota bacterium]|nr:C cytochrome precursor [Myxococcota bacterium]
MVLRHGVFMTVGRATGFPLWWIGAAFAVLIVSGLLPGAGSGEGPSEAGPVLADVQAAGYVSSGTCRSCHPGHYHSWFESFHRTMTQRADPGAVAADLDGLELVLPGHAYRFERAGDQFWVDLTDSEGTQRYPIELTTGSHHRQWLWLGTGRGRTLAAVPFIYLIEDERWVPRDAAFMHPPARNWSTRMLDGKWGVGCIQCHTTAAQVAAARGPGPRRDGGEASAVELGIACESCHGPGGKHVRENRSPGRRYLQHLDATANASIVDPSDLDHERATALCGQCHSLEAAQASSGFMPGELLDPVFETEQRREVWGDLAFWPDGRVRTGGREYDALVETECYRRGEASCLSCHSMHRENDDPRPTEEWRVDQLRVGHDGNSACLQCHEMPDIEAHTHHAAGSRGSNCYDCHSPHTSYALLKAIRNHGVEAPDVSVELSTGRPNACNLCHLDRSLGWTAEHLQDWYGIEPPELDADQREIAASVLWAVSGDAGQRALAAWHMGWEPAQQASGTHWLPLYLSPLLDDSYPAVRYLAWRSLRTLPGYADLDYDYVADQKVRSASAMAAFDRWWRTHRSNPRARPSVLLDAQGTVSQNTLARLLSERDERRLEWIE